MFADTKLLPPDPILGLTKLFQDDPRPDKIDLGVGVYRDINGTTPIMKAVAQAEANVTAKQTTKAYTPTDGAPGFGPAILDLIFGKDSETLSAGRAAAVQTPGGCGALRLAGELANSQGAASLTLGEPTWPNHVPLLSAAGLKLNSIPYYDRDANAVDFEAFKAGVSKLGPKDVLLLHGCCHNPTGADLSTEQIDEIATMAAAQGFLPLVDTAYHGFSKDLDADAYMVRKFSADLPEVLITYSCSKNFGLYRERTGALIYVGPNADNALAVKSHATSLARRNYSIPPAHGGAIVAEILSDAALTALWREELSEMAKRVQGNRRLLARTAENFGLHNQLSFIAEQAGMFSLLPLTDDQLRAMRDEHGVYIVGGGRINLCGVNENNVEHLVRSFKNATAP
ncbi:aromatic amino acid transaminase [Hyphococcus luteus]|uniref:Aromatic amino acid aminotransferase n=1 Tax=Hyphococcus luteus TaxID=2058213 RepID=A0A2S7K1P9_9PROT|nr:amino acid aminotransferase [Marinicaulis flavus]PQA86391.1 aromatic amino acid aminotransferase [Marinicaulis flavus]